MTFLLTRSNRLGCNFTPKESHYSFSLSYHQNHENASFLLTWTVPPAARSDFLFAVVDACRRDFFPEAVGRQPGCQSPVHGITPVTSSRFYTLPSGPGQSLPSLLPIRFGWFVTGMITGIMCCTTGPMVQTNWDGVIIWHRNIPVENLWLASRVCMAHSMPHALLIGR